MVSKTDATGCPTKSSSHYQRSRWKPTVFGNRFWPHIRSRRARVATRDGVHLAEWRSGCVQPEIAYIEHLMCENTSGDRQLAMREANHHLQAIVDHIVSETYEGLDISATEAIE